MINDAELKVVRRQLGRVETALASLRRDVKSTNEKMYEVMAESYIDLLQSLRADIDAYLGVAKTTSLAADGKHTEVEGVIRSIDLDAQTFVLRERPDNLPDLPCEYSTQIEEAVKELLGCRVSVAGTLDKSRMTHREMMEVETIERASTEEELSEDTPADASNSPAC
jgi:DNA replicative helicase MCM subunit Mcm2 (Cdc46/Mcm family)